MFALQTITHATKGSYSYLLSPPIRAGWKKTKSPKNWKTKRQLEGISFKRPLSLVSSYQSRLKNLGWFVLVIETLPSKIQPPFTESEIMGFFSTLILTDSICNGWQCFNQYQTSTTSGFKHSLDYILHLVQRRLLVKLSLVSILRTDFSLSEIMKRDAGSLKF